MSISPILITFVVFSVVGLPSGFSADQQYEECRLPLRCGSEPSVFPNITYPFWGNNIGKPNFCGQTEFELSCKKNETLTLEIENLSLRVIYANLDNMTITVADESLFDGGCPKILNFNGNDQLVLNSHTDIIDLFVCSSTDLVQSLSNITCQGSNENRTYHVFNASDIPPDCTKVAEIPMLESAKNALHQSSYSNQSLKMALEEGFELRYTIEAKTCRDCTNSNGICGSESGSENFRCLCEDKPHNSSCVANNEQGHFFKWKRGIIIASGFLVATLVAGGLLCFIIRRRKTSDDLRQQNLKALIPLKHYSYAEVKRITKSFAEVVGKGGFGTVYRGTLFDGRTVAVKILKDSKVNGEDFINEVSSMSKTSHVNIVDLLGFCSQGSKRAIIYEFLENGSLDKFISSKRSSNMDWRELYGIALGVARGLEYLHHGCKTRIVHFDIKPQNVLLDDNLCPKVSDFGLAKLCQKNESILSLLDTRGTIGYIAPELFSRMYGRVSHKSDVYSYGMLVLEMIGARNKQKADQNSESNASSMYFPEWIYKDLEKGENRRLIEDRISSEEEKIAKKMTLVGLWCIQSSPSDRPPMNRVVEMIEGSMDDLQVPPRPVFQIPVASLQESSIISMNMSSYREVCSINVA